MKKDIKYIIDHDLHIHTFLSICSRDPAQTPEHIIEYAKNHGLKYVCITDHFWDENVGHPNEAFKYQSITHNTSLLPLPKDKNVKLYFGAEADMDKDFKIGLTKKSLELFDFITMSCVHLHHDGFTIKENASLEDYKELYISRLFAFLNADLPFYKMGIAHITARWLGGINFENHLKIINSIPDKTYEEIFMLAKQKGCGIELNVPVHIYNKEQIKVVMRPLVIAKKCGCKFYLGSDIHHPKDEELYFSKFKFMIDYLDLKESDKFIPKAFK